ncbi:hypothetical protein KP509_26G062400 [Ceratopteris richardii]|uniref:Uncharacterized protein n=1 Tax=Ceratopteris richardii TaxID=49495 RepID=A0A8T2RP85_CERRI|nr:hypothetical protein KP509_26G062400 [Ceratopteris richardii]
MLHEYVVKQQRCHLLDSMKESENPCCVCGSLPLITKTASVYSAGKNRDVYFLAEEAYTPVLVILGMLGIVSETLLLKLINLRKFTLSHGCKKDVCHVLDAWEVLYQSCGRDCSANNDEDRILVIKGLLGANSKTQVVCGSSMLFQSSITLYASNAYYKSAVLPYMLLMHITKVQYYPICF